MHISANLFRQDALGNNLQEPVKTYRMKTATSSTVSVPYLATKTIEDLANVILYEVTYYRKTFIWMFWWEARIQSQSVELFEMKS